MIGAILGDIIGAREVLCAVVRTPVFQRKKDASSDASFFKKFKVLEPS